ncbi:calcium-transporting ATPase 12, plasma membrane-type-like [Pistacia vera]|uniref:calcium-transporting ATPase 12, plasma membrane-type-like n=1 Tax=Pistacia vera TaxID=55513 RepID=UPI0012635274|nr:calcium-transporting ATPase 12, plasma membrane-type-like [Pistacia vera]
MDLRSRKPSEKKMLKLKQKEDSTAPSKLHQRRWRMAFRAICFTKVLASLSRKVLENKSLLRSVSYHAIDVPNENQGNNNGSKAFPDDVKKKLSEMVKDKILHSLEDFGGVKQIATLLESHPETGISGKEADLAERRNGFGENRYKKPPLKGFLSFVLEAFKDTTIIILLVCAVLSLVFGIKEDGWKEGWYDRGSIIIAVILVVSVSTGSNFKQSRQFEALSDESNEIQVEVVRDGRRHRISIFDIVVGDVVPLKIGNQIPADGLFLEGQSLKVDESSMTGESDHVEVNEKNPFLLSGTKVTDGFGFMLVTSVGMSTAWGQLMSTIRHEVNETTPLQSRLNVLTSYIGRIGLTVAILVLAVMLIRYFTGSTRDEKGNKEFQGSKTKFDDVMKSVIRIIAAAVTILVVAIPEGLPLAVTLTLAFSMKRMMKDHAMVRKLSACETMGSATKICTDKTGTLTVNQMKVTEFWLGKEKVYVASSEGGASPEDVVPSEEVKGNFRNLLQEAIGLNTTGSVYKPAAPAAPEISGNPTEKAILSWAVNDWEMDVNEPKHSCQKIQIESFNSEKKRSGLSVKRYNEEGEGVHMHWMGAAEIIFAMCSHYYLKDGKEEAMDDEKRNQISKIIEGMAGKSLRCIAMAHKKVEETEKIQSNLEETGLILLGIFGLKDPCRPGVSEAVKSCTSAGVKIKMVTGDNLHTARAIAIECGILEPDFDDEAIVEGVKFRNYSPQERDDKIETIRVMARSSPFDKLLMVQTLKKKGQVVAVTGDGTNDAPALKEADIGLSMGIQGTEIAKESSDIIIMDDNFTTVVTVLKWGRCVFNNIQKFLQFQLTVNVAALVINFVAAVSSGKVPLSAVQLLWVNLIMDSLGALALATEPPTNDLMKKTPVGRSKPLITRVMWRNLISQTLYQVAVLLILQFRGKEIFKTNERVNNTMIFNTFVLCQVFNEFNSRNLEKKNIFRGIWRNKLFLAIIAITIVLQLIMVELLKNFANTERLNWGQWGFCVGIAALSWPIAFIFKLVPVRRASNPGSRREDSFHH